MDEKRPAEVGLSNDRDASFRFDVLGQEFREHNLLGEKFRPDGDFGLRTLTAGSYEVNEVKEAKEIKESERSAVHG